MVEHSMALESFDLLIITSSQNMAPGVEASKKDVNYFTQTSFIAS